MLWKIRLYHLLFALSGACALGYEIVWSRQFAMGLGHELPGILGVIAAFFGGISIGAIAFDRRVSGSARPGNWYAALEFVIGVWSFATILLIPAINGSGFILVGLGSSSVRQWLTSFAAPFLVLLPATMAMGATFPAMERLVARSGRIRCVSALYAANTIGAVAGTLATTFALAPILGFRTTLICLGVLNVIGAMGALALAPGRQVPETIEHASSHHALNRSISRSRILTMAFACGVLGIGYEVLGIRLLSEVLENTIYTFAAALSVYLIGTSLGAALFQRFGKSSSTEFSLVFLFSGTSMACLVGAWPLADAQAMYDWARTMVPENSIGVLAAEMLVSGAVFGPATLCMGATFGLLVQAAKHESGGVGSAVAVNTLGSAIAPGLFGVLLLPRMGAKWMLIVIAAGYIVLLLQVNKRKRSSGFTKDWRPWFAFAVPIILMLFLPAHLHSVRPPRGGELLVYRPGVMDSVAVVKHFDGHRSLLVNNRFIMGGTGAAAAARRHAHIPLLLHPEPKRALFLGLGTGITFAAAGAHGLDADGVELVPEILEMYAHFSPENALRPRMNIHSADARRFVRAISQTYDVIVADLFHPAREGAGSLYTIEHFQAIRNRLAPRGIFCQWLPLFQMDERMLRAVTASFVRVFPHTRAYLLRFNIDTPVLGLIASLDEVIYPVDWMQNRVRDDELRTQLKALTLIDDFQLFGCFLADSGALRHFAAGAALNTDDRPVVTFEAPRFTYRRNEPSHARLMRLIAQFPATANGLIQAGINANSAEFVIRLNRFIEARNRYLAGLVAEETGKRSEAIHHLLESVRMSPDFTTGYAHCLTIALREWPQNPGSTRKILEDLIKAQPERPVAKQLLMKLTGEATRE